eukprot:TRINITY_DN1066_c0_g1_i2.p1 TRINITY_DN1066_c0_g1~~TRINITY_DN1066_c0_g1_i2.p1  ORF type:complete len:1057 (+),score=278.65 TRINITY_DN1066_c0_g1_i2:71-3241(+)
MLWGLVGAAVCTAAVGRSPVVLVAFDEAPAVGQAAPHMAQLRKDGASAAGGITAAARGLPVQACPLLHTMATGQVPEAHGVVANSMYDPDLKSTLDCSEPEAGAGTSEWFRGTPIWARAATYGLRAGVIGWPGGSAVYDGFTPDARMVAAETASTADRVNLVESWVTDVEAPVDLVLARFPAAVDVGNPAYRVDTIVGTLRAALPATTNLIVLTGVNAAAAPRKVVDMSVVLPGIADFARGSVSPMLTLFAAGEAAAEELYVQLLAGRTAAGHDEDIVIYRRRDLPAAAHLKGSARVGDVVVFARPRVALVLGPHSVPGRAGGAETVGWYGVGPSFRAATEVSDDAVLTGVELYPLLCGLLTIPGKAGAPHGGFGAVLQRSPLREHWHDRLWLPARSHVTVYPQDGASFAPGAEFDIAVIVPHGLPGADPAAAAVTYTTTSLSAVHPPVFCSPVATVVEQTAEAAGTRYTYTQHVHRACKILVGGSVTVHVASGRLSATAEYSVKTKPGGGAKNVVLVIGDGMSLPMITATRLLTRGRLPVDDYDYNGLAFTKALDSIVTDSAAAASALNTGHKTFNGGLGVYPDAGMGETGSTNDNPRVETFAEYVRRTKGMKVGVVTTASMVDATPAGVWAHCAERSAYPAIAEQALDLQPEVILGGGRSVFENAGLFGAFTAAGYTSVTTAAALANATASEKLLGLFAPKHLHTANDRRADPSNTQPSLPAMATAALDVLHRGPDDHFYLMVEAASIDKQAHSCDSARMLGDSLELQETLVVLEEELARRGILDETLIVVTSDHATGGYDVYGTVDTDVARGGDVNEGIKMYGTAEWPDWVAKDFRVENWDTAQWTFAGVNNNHPDYKEDFRAKHWLKEGWIGREEDRGALSGIALADNVGRTLHEEAHDTAVHTTSDVMVFAKGPGARLFNGGYENTEVFHNMIAALGVRPPSPDEDEFAELLKEINEKKAAVAAMAAELAERHATNVDAADACGSGEKSLQGLAVVALLLAATSVISNCCRKLQLRGHTRLDGEAAWPSPTAREMDMEVLDDDLVSDADEA